MNFHLKFPKSLFRLQNDPFRVLIFGIKYSYCAPRLASLAWPARRQRYTSFQLVHCYRLQTNSFFCRSHILSGCGVSGGGRGGKGSTATAGVSCFINSQLVQHLGAIFSSNIENFWCEYCIYRHAIHTRCSNFRIFLSSYEKNASALTSVAKFIFRP